MEKSKKKPHHYRKRIVSGCTTLFLLAAVVCFMYIVLQSISNGYVKCGKSSLFRVVTGSMEPTIPTGAILRSKQIDIESVKKGDIICFRSTNPGSEGVIITHRVVGIYTKPDNTLCLQTKGDNKETNPTVDINPVTKENLIGRVVWHTGDGSVMANIINFLTDGIGFLVCIVLVLLVAVWVFRDAAKNLRKEIVEAEAKLEQQEKQKQQQLQQIQQEQPPAMSEEEIQKLREQIEEELRKEMEQNAQACDADDANAQTDSAEPATAPSEGE